MPIPPPLKLGARRVFGQMSVIANSTFTVGTRQMLKDPYIPAFRVGVNGLDGGSVLEGAMILLCNKGTVEGEVLG